MNFSIRTKNFIIIVFTLAFLGMTVSARAMQVQVYVPVDPEKEVPQRVLRDKAVSRAFAEAIYMEASSLVHGALAEERGKALKDILATRYEDFILGYKDMEVQQDEEGVSVSVDADVNRKGLKESLRKMGMFAADSGSVPAFINISNGRYKLNESQQAGQDWQVVTLKNLYGVSNTTAADGNGTAVVFNADHVAKNSWSGDLKSGADKWFASGPDLFSVWNQLWGKYYSVQKSEGLSSPKVVLVVNGWFTPDGVREFDRRLKSWDAAVQEVLLLDIEMRPTSVSASWTMEVSDQWILKSNLNDYIPLRGLSYTMEGLEGEQ